MGSALSYTGGYDDGLRDGLDGQPRAYPRLLRETNADQRRVGYDAGYADGETRRQANPPPVATDPRVGPHPFVGPKDICQLPGCNRAANGTIHDMDGPEANQEPAYLALLEAAKAVARETGSGKIVAVPTSTNGHIALALLDQAVAWLGHPTREPRPSELAMAAAKQDPRWPTGIEQYQADSR